MAVRPLSGLNVQMFSYPDERVCGFARLAAENPNPNPNPNRDGFPNVYTGLGTGSRTASSRTSNAYPGSGVSVGCCFSADRTGSNMVSGRTRSVFTTITWTPRSRRSSRRDALAPTTACRAESKAVIPCRPAIPLDVPKLMKRPENIHGNTPRKGN